MRDDSGLDAAERVEWNKLGVRSEELGVKCSERAGQKVRIQEDSDVERLFGEGCLLSAADRDAVEGAAGAVALSPQKNGEVRENNSVFWVLHGKLGRGIDKNLTRVKKKWLSR